MTPCPKLFLALSAAAFLAACTQTSGPPAAPAVSTTAATASAAGGCAAEVGQFRAVIDSDNATGNVNASVYKRMAAEVDRAAAACAAGRDAEARTALSGTKRRYGYP
jgi:type IV secretory pathway TrbL component